MCRLWQSAYNNRLYRAGNLNSQINLNPSGKGSAGTDTDRISWLAALQPQFEGGTGGGQVDEHGPERHDGGGVE